MCSPLLLLSLLSLSFCCSVPFPLPRPRTLLSLHVLHCKLHALSWSCCANGFQPQRFQLEQTLQGQKIGQGQTWSQPTKQSQPNANNTCACAERQRGREAERQRNREAEKQRHRHRHRHTQTQTQTQTHRHTDTDTHTVLCFSQLTCIQSKDVINAPVPHCDSQVLDRIGGAVASYHATTSTSAHLFGFLLKRRLKIGSDTIKSSQLGLFGRTRTEDATQVPSCGHGGGPCL